MLDIVISSVFLKELFSSRNLVESLWTSSVGNAIWEILFWEQHIAQALLRVKPGSLCDGYPVCQFNWAKDFPESW